MITSQKGLDFIAKEEGIVLKPYKDSVGVWTIGIGSTRWEDGTSIKSTDKPINLDRAYKLFKTTLKQYEEAVNTTITREINQNQFDALVSLCYNIGTGGFKGSTVAKRVNKNPCDPTIADAFHMWQNAGKLKGLLLPRRKRESSLYFS